MRCIMRKPIIKLISCQVSLMSVDLIIWYHRIYICDIRLKREAQGAKIVRGMFNGSNYFAV